MGEMERKEKEKSPAQMLHENLSSDENYNQIVYLWRVWRAKKKGFQQTLPIFGLAINVPQNWQLSVSIASDIFASVVHFVQIYRKNYLAIVGREKPFFFYFVFVFGCMSVREGTKSVSTFIHSVLCFFTLMLLFK